MTSTEQFYSEENRLKTFQEKGWPLSFLKPESLAKCGFFYMGDGDRVQCPFCGIVIFNWQSGDEPIFEHKIHSSKCPFINGRDVGNIFIDTDPREIYALAKSEDVCGFHHLQSQEKKESEIKAVKPADGPGIAYKPPQSIEFVTYGSRLASFKDWPIPDVISPAQLAESGFYFKGPVIDYLGNKYEDFVTCFHCGIALCQWTSEDNPWEEHFKFNSNCIFLFLVARQDTSLAPIESIVEPSLSPVETSTPPEVSPAEPSPSSSSEPEPSLLPSVESSSPTTDETTEPLSSKSPLPSSVEASLTSTETTESSSSQSILYEECTSTATTTTTTTTTTTAIATEAAAAATTTTTTTTPSDEASMEPSLELPSSEPSPSEPSSSQPNIPSKPFIPFAWLPKPKTEDLCCKVCLDYQVGVTFHPCLHTSCPLCAASLTNCPICRTNIIRAIRLDYELSKTKISFYL